MHGKEPELFSVRTRAILLNVCSKQPVHECTRRFIAAKAKAFGHIETILTSTLTGLSDCLTTNQLCGDPTYNLNSPISAMARLTKTFRSFRAGFRSTTVEKSLLTGLTFDHNRKTHN